MSKIVLKYYTIPNLGDAMNLFLFNFMLDGKVKYINDKEKISNPTLLAIGSILHWVDYKTIVWGSGFISEKSKIRSIPKEVLAVRGPFSRKMLTIQGVNCPEVYGDPALLYPRFYYPEVCKKYKLGIIPHYIDRNNVLIKKIIDSKDVLLIDVQANVNEVVKQILSCERIASSSLHGLIVADAYGISSSWIKFSEKVIGCGFKFRDYFSSVGRKKMEPLIMDSSVKIKDILNSFEDYNIEIDLDKLHNICPLDKIKLS